MAARPFDFGTLRGAAAAVGLALSACATPATTDAPVPSLRTATRIEKGLALLDALRTVGMTDSASLNANSVVHLRDFSCRPAGSDTALCTYEADRCLPEDGAALPGGWCRRTRRFVRAPADPVDPSYAEGWRAAPDPN